ncbi:MAG TPA: group I intron-associated PD-(D/E)XK endonuclease [Gaiellaceae bacterium]
MEHPKDKGDRTTLAVLLALRACGYAVLVPFGENTRYDLVIDDGGSLSRVQCKTGRLRAGAVWFSVCSCYGHHLRPGQARRDYRGQVEYFGVHCPDTEMVYLVPIEHLDVKTVAALRVDPPKNAQRLRVRDAARYEIGHVLCSPVADRCMYDKRPT